MTAAGVFMFSSVFLLFLANGISSHDPPAAIYKINLDLEPEKRWLEVVKDYSQIVKDINKVFLTYVPEILMPLLQKLASQIDQYFPTEYAREIRGIASALKTDVGTIVLGNIVYDLTAHCTSIVAQDSNGTIWHARNMDYTFTNMLRNLTVFLHFQKNNKTIFSSTSFVGSIGVLTGQRHGAFSISVDERGEKYAFWHLFYNALVALLDKNASIMTFAVRNALENKTTFAAAVEYLQKTDTMAPVYYIMAGAGPQEGAVITRDRLKAVDTWYLNKTEHRWYLVETNYDHWLPTPKSDQRRQAAVKMMDTLGQQGVQSSGLFKILHTQPIFRDITIYTSIMCPRDNTYQNWVW